MKQKKIAFIFDNLTYRGGNIKQLIELANYFSSTGNKVTVFSTNFDFKNCFPEIKKNFSVKQIGYKQKNNFLLFYHNRVTKKNLMQKLIMQENSNFDVFFIHDSPFYGLSAFLKKMYPQSKLVWHMNDLPYIFNISVDTNQKFSLVTKIIGKMLRVVDKYYICKFDLITTLSSANKKNITYFFNKKSIVVHTGTDNFFYQKIIKEDLRKKSVINLLTVGAFYQARRYEDIIKAVYELNNLGNKTFNLRIVGHQGSDTRYAKAIKDLIKESDLTSRITFETKLSNNNLKLVYKNADIYVQATNNIGWTIPATEAMLSSLPTIITNSCGLNEVLVTGVHALIIQPKNPELIIKAILNIVNNNKLALRLSIYGRELISKEFIWSRYCTKYDEFIMNYFRIR